MKRKDWTWQAFTTKRKVTYSKKNLKNWGNGVHKNQSEALEDLYFFILNESISLNLQLTFHKSRAEVGLHNQVEFFEKDVRENDQALTVILKELEKRNYR